MDLKGQDRCLRGPVRVSVGALVFVYGYTCGVRAARRGEAERIHRALTASRDEYVSNPPSYLLQHKDEGPSTPS